MAVRKLLERTSISGVVLANVGYRNPGRPADFPAQLAREAAGNGLDKTAFANAVRTNEGKLFLAVNRAGEGMEKLPTSKCQADLVKGKECLLVGLLVVERQGDHFFHVF